MDNHDRLLPALDYIFADEIGDDQRRLWTATRPSAARRAAGYGRAEVDGLITMPMVDFSHLSPQERLDLIGELWDSLAPDAAPVTAAQKAEIQRRLATLDKDIATGRDVADVLADLRHRHG